MEIPKLSFEQVASVIEAVEDGQLSTQGAMQELNQMIEKNVEAQQATARRSIRPNCF